MNLHPTSWPDAAVTIVLLVIGAVLISKLIDVVGKATSKR